MPPFCQGGGGGSSSPVHGAKQLVGDQDTKILPSGLSTAATAVHCRCLCDPALLHCCGADLLGCNAAALLRKGLHRSWSQCCNIRCSYAGLLLAAVGL